MVVKCAVCECTPMECNQKKLSEYTKNCSNCNMEDKCCCLSVHTAEEVRDDCCSESLRNGMNEENDVVSSVGRIPQNKSFDNDTRPEPKKYFRLRSFFLYVKSLYAAALGIEILCIAAAEMGENTGLYIFGFNAGGIAVAYVMGYTLAGFVTFVTILGRYGNHTHSGKGKSIVGIDSCCSVLEQDSTQRFIPNLKTTFANFVSGFKRLFRIRSQKGMKMILKSSLFVLVTAESACILTAETVDLIFYQYSILLSIPLALLAGAFTVVAPAAYRKARVSRANARTAGTI
jgi:hypothetical protein